MRETLAGQDHLRLGRHRPAVPEDLRVYAVGDIHGRLDLLNPLLQAIDADIADHPVGNAVCVFVGDYIDRGPQSRGTIERLIEYDRQQRCIFLKGNHEHLAVNALRDPAVFDAWLCVGGRTTLQSYDVKIDPACAGTQIPSVQAAFHSALPAPHFNFFRKLRLSFECGDFFFAHAGVRPGIDLTMQKESDLLWIRDAFLGCEHGHGKIVVHGHTPNTEIDVRTNRINIDTGAFATENLTCLMIEGDRLFVVRPD